MYFSKTTQDTGKESFQSYHGRILVVAVTTHMRRFNGFIF